MRRSIRERIELWRRAHFFLSLAIYRDRATIAGFNGLRCCLARNRQKNFIHVSGSDEGRSPIASFRRSWHRRTLLERFFGSSPGVLALTLLEDERLSDKDIGDLKRMIERRRKSR